MTASVDKMELLQEGREIQISFWFSITTSKFTCCNNFKKSVLKSPYVLRDMTDYTVPNEDSVCDEREQLYKASRCSVTNLCLKMPEDT